MTKLVKMEWYKLRTTKMFIIFAAITFGLNLAFAAVVPLIMKMISSIAEPVALTNAIANPFYFSLLMIPMYISAISFLYADFAGGYIKNYAGQVGSRGRIVASKFIVLGIHNLIFFILGALSSALGAAIAGTLVFDGNVFSGIGTMLLKWLLSLAISSILMFLAVGIKNKTLATIVGVIFATGALNLAYMGISTGVMNIFKLEEFVLSNYLPDGLISTVNVGTNTLVLNAILVGLIFIAAFVTLTYFTFKKRDIK